jgi:hypothetical protein
MTEELWGFLLMSLVSVGPVTDADIQPKLIGKFQTQAACEAEGNKLDDKIRSFALGAKKNLKVRVDHICLPQAKTSN